MRELAPLLVCVVLAFGLGLVIAECRHRAAQGAIATDAEIERYDTHNDPLIKEPLPEPE